MKIGNVEVGTRAVFGLAERDTYDFKYDHLRSLTLATVFLTESVRTRTTFEKAALDFNMGVITVNERRSGEPLPDFGFAISQVADICVCRLENSNEFDLLTQHARIPFIDGGLGTSSHPTQALIDVYTLFESDLPDDAKIGLFGPTNNRAMRSFRELAGRFWTLEEFHPYEHGEYDAVYCVTTGNAQTLPTGLDCKILHPFPRGSVIPHCYDFTPQDLYHRQMENAVRVRKAILCMAYQEYRKTG